MQGQVMHLLHLIILRLLWKFQSSYVLILKFSVQGIMSIVFLNALSETFYIKRDSIWIFLIFQGVYIQIINVLMKVKGPFFIDMIVNKCRTWIWDVLHRSPTPLSLMLGLKANESQGSKLMKRDMGYWWVKIIINCINFEKIWKLRA